MAGLNPSARYEDAVFITSSPVGIFFTMQTVMFFTSIRNAKSTLLVALFLLGAVFPTAKKPPLKRSGNTKRTFGSIAESFPRLWMRTAADGSTVTFTELLVS